MTKPSNFVFESSSGDASSKSLFSPDSEDCSETSNSGSDNTLSHNSDDNVAGAQQSTSRNLLRTIRNQKLHVILLSGINLQLLSHPSFPLMITSQANLHLQCLLHYRKLIPSKLSI